MSYPHNSSSAPGNGYFYSQPTTQQTASPAAKKDLTFNPYNLSQSPPHGESTPLKPELARTLHPGTTFQIHPLRSIILIFWFIYIAVLFWLLETAVKDGKSNPYPAWHLKTLPELFLTFFAQGHAAITATYLARISASAIQSPRTAPRTWVEMFWMTDRVWSGPIGILGAIIEVIRLRIRVSITFILFSVTCIVAIITPSILTRAYPVENVIVNVREAIQPKTFAPSSAIYDAYLQEGGMGSWSSGLPAIQLYNSTIFIPDNSNFSRDPNSNIEPSDMFIAGDIGSANVTVPGLRLQGGCSVDDSQTEFPPTTFNTTAPEVCTLLNFQPGGTMETATSSSYALDIHIWMCAEAGFSSLRNTTQDEGYVYYTYTQTTTDTSEQGLIRCQTSFSTGYAHVLGETRTFVPDSFDEVGLFKQDPSGGGEAPSEPMAAAWRVLGATLQSQTNRASLISGLGFQAESGGDFSIRYPTVSADMIANRMWSSIAHLTTNMAIMSWSDREVYLASVPISAAVHVRLYPFAPAAYALLGLWLVLVVSIPFYAWKRSFVDHLDSYVASTLVLHHGSGLVEDMPLGDSSENNKLTQSFVSSEIESRLTELKMR